VGYRKVEDRLTFWKSKKGEKKMRGGKKMAELFLGCATLSSNWARVQVERWWWDMHPGLQRLAAVVKALSLSVCVEDDPERQ
jgi:hypothetical protein